MNDKKLKILQISPMIPFPLDNGGRLGIHGITNYLAKRSHNIDFVAYRKDSDYNYAFYELSKICTPHILDVQTDNSIPGAFLNLFSKVPYNVSKYHNTELKKFLSHYLRNNKPDIIHVDNVHLAWTIDIIRELSDCPAVLREHNVELLIMKRFSVAQRNPVLKKYSEIQYKKFLNYEPEMCAMFDTCLMITEEDRKYILSLKPQIKTTIIPAGVNSNLLSRTPVPLKPHTLFHVGSLKWLPNIDGLKWFLKEIFPSVINRIPDVKLFIYGEGSENLEIEPALKNNVVICGWVENLFDEIADKDLAVVPLRIGGGMRIKIIELMALGKNIISTSVGKEGIAVKKNEHMLVADSAETFSSEIVGHFSAGPRIITESCRQFVRDNYTWEKVAEMLEHTYLKLISEKKA